MLADLKELWRFRELLWAMVERELRIRYKNSALGFLWSLLNPLVTVAVMWSVFTFLLGNNTENYSAYILAAYLPFLFFNMALMDSAQSVLGSLNVVKKVYFPREILPLASVIGNFIHFVLALGVFFLFLFGVWAFTGFQVAPFTWRLVALPFLLVPFFALVVGCSLLISALNVFYEDVKYILSVFLYLLFFVSPVMYFSETVRSALAGRSNGALIETLYHLNPVATFITAFRKVLVPPGRIEIIQDGVAVKVPPAPFDYTMVGVACVVSFVMMVFGYWVFNRMKWRFVERP
jgi:lipopolysaccharide transport system permease protein